MGAPAMKSNAILSQPPVQLAFAAILVIGFVYILTRKTVSDIFSGVSDVNKGTPFEGSGVVGTIGNATNTVLGGAPAAVGEKISRFFFPMDDATENLFYVATFPDGQRHAVPSLTVNAQGFFYRGGVRYRLGFNSDGKRIAVSA